MARKVGLGRGDVVRSAASIADRDGLDAVTLAAVAGDLGVKSPSLYAHVAGTDGLRHALAFHANKAIHRALAEAADTPGEPDERLRAVANAYRVFANQHSGLYASLLPAPDPATDPELAEAARRSVDVVIALLPDAARFDDSDTIHRIRAFRAALHGFVSLENDGGFGLPVDLDASFDHLVDTAVDTLLRK